MLLVPTLASKIYPPRHHTAWPNSVVTVVRRQYSRKIVNMSFHQRNHPKEYNVRQIRQCNGMFDGPGLTVMSMIERIETDCSTGAGSVVVGYRYLASAWPLFGQSLFPSFSPPTATSKSVHPPSGLHPPWQVPAAVLFFPPV